MMPDTPDEDEHQQEIERRAAEEWAFEARGNAGPPIAEQKAHEAEHAEWIADMDRKRGNVDVTYEQFRAAFDDGDGCEALFDLRNRMHPKDPLKEAANEDLRSVGCFSRGSTRR